MAHLQMHNGQLIKQRDDAYTILEKLHARVFNDNGDMTINLEDITADITDAYFLIKKARK